MSTSSARTWALAVAAAKLASPVRVQTVKNLHHPAAEARRIRAVGCTKESERDMAQNILNLVETIMRKIRSTLTPALVPAVQPRPRLNGRWGYGDDSIKLPD
jgi:hypothetical protein